MMMFSILNYLQPTHYFKKLNRKGHFVFPKVELLPEHIVSQLERDNGFQSSVSTEYDMSWQAIHKGYVGDTETYSEFESLPVVDNYRFIRKYFHPSWVIYVLVLRLLSFHNPLTELRAWSMTRSVKRSLCHENPIIYPEWSTFESKLISENPKISVIIPTLNRYTVLKDILHDLEQQEYKNFEVIVIDQSDGFNPEFYQAFNLEFQIVRQLEKALWLARNTGIKRANGQLIALSEDDVRVNPDWLTQHIRCLEFFNAKVSAGVFFPKGKEIPKERSYFAMATQFATGNALLYKSVFNIVGLFDRQFEKQRMGDGEFGLRVHIEGILSVSNPYASCIDVKAPKGGLREMGSWDAFRPSNFFAPRPIPSVLYFFRRYYGNASARLSLLRLVPLSLFSYKLKKNRVVLLLSLFLSVLLLPVIFYQVWKSWRLASEKLEQGPLIDRLD